MQCIHQHTPLTDVLFALTQGQAPIVEGYLRYKSHVCRQVYADPEDWQSRQAVIEEAWPEYADSLELLSQRRYLVSESMKGRDWCHLYLQHVQSVQEMKNHHVHTLNSKGERVPLTHCRRADDPTKCKGDFPRTRWLIDRPVVLCQGLLHQMGLASSGRRNRLGSLHGPQNDPNLNGTAPAQLVSLLCNSDVQLPYRLPLTEMTHADASLCSERCWEQINTMQMVEAAQLSQDAQAGYACDYQNKRSARSCNEVKECVKGHRQLAEDTAGKRPAYIGKRHVTRLCSDAYGKGIVRSNQESTNLRVYARNDDVTSAEAFHTAQTVVMPGKTLSDWREAVCAQAELVDVLEAATLDHRNPAKTTAVYKNVVFLYGHRPTHPDVWYLSPYDFMVLWHLELATFNLDPRDDEDSPGHCVLTDRGKARALAATGHDRSAAGQAPDAVPDMRPGVHYRVREAPESHEDWLPLPQNGFTNEYRHTWVLVRNRRPKDPSFMHCPMPRRGVDTEERNAAIVLTYFHPFTLDPDRADQHVPFIGHLCKGHPTWHAAMKSYFAGKVLCEESRRHLTNFLVVTRARPDMDASGEAGSDDLASDEELHLDKDSFEQALRTRMGTGKRQPSEVTPTTQEQANRNEDAKIKEETDLHLHSLRKDGRRRTLVAILRALQTCSSMMSLWMG